MVWMLEEKKAVPASASAALGSRGLSPHYKIPYANNTATTKAMSAGAFYQHQCAPILAVARKTTTTSARQ
jgi:hypothetical protein